MRPRRLTILAVAILVLAGLVFLLSRPGDEGGAQGELLLPGLEAALPELEKLVIVGAGGQRLASIERGPERWTVAEAGHYPADISMIRRNLLELAEARIVEAKTSNPEFYDRLGLRDVSDADAGGRRFDIEGSDYSASVIVGHTDARGGEMAYVRKAGQARSYLVDASIEAPDELQDWLDRTVFDIPSAEIRRVRIEHPDGHVLVIEKTDPEATEFEVRDVPEGRELTYPGVANSIGSALSGLQFDSVTPAGELDAPETPPVLTSFETFDGLTIEARSWRADEEQWRIAFAVSVTEPPALDDAETAGEGAAGNAARAAELNRRVDGWIYTLPSYKTDQLIKRKSDLLAAQD